MDRPSGINNTQLPSQPLQGEGVREPKDALETIVRGRRSAFGRGVSKLKNAFSHLRKGQQKITQNIPATTSIQSRRVSAVKTTKPLVEAKLPHQVLRDIDRSLTAGEGLSREVKEGLVSVKNQYLSSGLKFAREQRNKLNDDIGNRTEQRLDNSAQEKQLQQVDLLINRLEQGLDDPRIKGSSQVENMRKFFNEVKELPHTLGEQLVNLNFKSSDETLTEFYSGVRELSDHLAQIETVQKGAHFQKINKHESTQSHRELFDVQELHFKAAIKIAAGAADEAIGRGDIVTHRKFSELTRSLEKQLNNTYRTMQLKGDGDVSKEGMKQAKQLPEILKDQLVATGLPQDDMKKVFRTAQVEQLNGSGWKTHERTIEASGLKLTSTQQPACDMVGGLPDEEMKGVFKVPYSRGEGVSSMDTANSKHATNLHRSSFQVNGKPAFNGIRHGILTPYGEKDKDVRSQGAQQKAEEALIMALASKPELYQQALKCVDGETPIPRLLTTSTSLVTATIGTKEDKMQKQQEKALKSLLAKAKGGVLELEVPGPNGPRKVKFAVKVAQFNIPVNIFGVGRFQKITGGRVTQQKLNKPAMQDLFGKDGKSGEVDFALKKIDWDIKVLNKQLSKSGPDKQNQIREEISGLVDKEKHIKTLSRQVKTIYKNGEHHAQGGDAYKLPVRLAVLTDMIGGVPMYNCKSGKDRTGMMDAEIKLLVTRMIRDGEVPEPGPLGKQDQVLFDSILLNSLNHEIQKNNARVKGFKTEHLSSIDQRIGDPEVRRQVRGLARVIGS